MYMHVYLIYYVYTCIYMYRAIYDVFCVDRRSIEAGRDHTAKDILSPMGANLYIRFHRASLLTKRLRIKKYREIEIF